MRPVTSVWHVSRCKFPAACRWRSDAEFVGKLGTVIEEADETAFWLELLGEAREIEQSKLAELIDEGRQLVRIFSAGKRTTKGRMENEKSKMKNEN